MWIGVDPGGKDAFGLAILNDDGQFSTHCFSCADEAIKHLSERPTGIGIDAPMWWSSGLSGDRLADEWIRKQYPQIGYGTIQAANSLRGACLVQGALFAERARQLFPAVPITEAHPKAVLRALGYTWSEFCSAFAVKGIAENDEHRQDALVSAVAAREGFEGRWPIDLGKKRYECEQDPSAYWLAPMDYFWPNTAS
jgi:predicted nuclease with RNAse H fold